MLIDYDEVFSKECMNEIRVRNTGNVFYGPPKAYGIATCEIQTVMMGSIELTRE